MNDSKRNIYLSEFLMFIYLVLNQIFVIMPFKSSKHLSYIEMIIWLILLIIILITKGFPRDNSYFKKIGIRYTIIYCFIYIFIIYGLGLFTGFSHSIYSHTINGLFNNLFPVLLMTISREVIRYIYCKKSNGKIFYLLFLSFIYVSYDLLLVSNYYTFNNSEQIFIFICVELFGSMAKNFLFTYITYYVSLIPTCILASVVETFWYIVPVIPSLGNYITSVLGILLPYFLYLKMRKIIKYGDKKELNKKHSFLIPIFLTIFIIFVLVSGIGKYKMIAIASDSMNPIYYKGDAIIYVKANASDINKGDILVFSSNNMTITHRVVDIIKIGNKSFFKTKGDNNENADIDLISEDNVYGKVKYIVKYIGYPTYKLRETFNK